MKVNLEDVAKRIKRIRLENGWTLEELGEKLDTSKVSVFSWESGRNLPNKMRIKMISDLANISVNELLYGEQNNIISFELLTDINLKNNHSIPIGFDIEDVLDFLNKTDYETLEVFKDSYLVEDIRAMMYEYDNYIEAEIDDLIKIFGSNVDRLELGIYKNSTIKLI